MSGLTKDPSGLFDPINCDLSQFDPETRRLFRATIEWFERRGKRTLLRQYNESAWYGDFLEFQADQGLFARLLTPVAEAGGNPGKRWDTGRIAAFSEILAFYGLGYWYTWQVTILGLGPIWQSANVEAKQRAARLLDNGDVFAFGLSEQTHGADIYATDMVLTPSEFEGHGGFRASGSKYYIGNGNVAGMVSVFGRREDIDGPEGYVFFAVDSRHPAYQLVKNTVNAQMYVSEFRLEDYPVRPQDILHTGQAAFEAALNTVNIGKFNIGFASIGMCEHAFHEAITHAHNRVLYGRHVTEFPHVRRAFIDAYARLRAMKLFSTRAIDYFRSANPQDRRYLLFNPVTKMKVTTEGEKVTGELWDVIAARGFEKDTYFNQVAKDISAPAKLEGTVHVNLALILKFMPNYLFAPQDREEVAVRDDVADDEFLFRQGPTRGLRSITFADWRHAFDAFDAISNVALFRDQAEALTRMLAAEPPTPEQQRDTDFLLSLGELFTNIVYAQLILEQAAIDGTEAAVLDQIFDVLVRDVSVQAVQLHNRVATTDTQRNHALALVRSAVADPERVDAIWERVAAVSGTYEMNPGDGELD